MITRQILRSAGRREIQERLKARFPWMPRTTRKLLAKKVQAGAWAKRDQAQIAELKKRES